MLIKGTASLEVKSSERNRELENFASLEPRVWNREFARYYCILAYDFQIFFKILELVETPVLLLIHDKHVQ